MKKVFVKDFPFGISNSFLFLRNYSDPSRHLKFAYSPRFFFSDIPHPLPNGDYLFHKYSSCAQLVLKADDEVFLWISD